ncbi:MAG: hypothetical protein COA75_07220 [Cellvibrionales bacterium]|nr:MAG: hypothetical protein COA75_07220 [Cellvibrionales bacterium]
MAGKDINPFFLKSNFGLVDLHITWPAMVGYHAGSGDLLDEKTMRLFTTFEEDKGSSGDDYYLLLQERIKNRLLPQPKISNGRIEYIRPSTKYPGLTEYWSTVLTVTKEELNLVGLLPCK